MALKRGRKSKRKEFKEQPIQYQPPEEWYQKSQVSVKPKKRQAPPPTPPPSFIVPPAPRQESLPKLAIHSVKKEILETAKQPIPPQNPALRATQPSTQTVSNVLKNP